MSSDGIQKLGYDNILSAFPIVMTNANSFLTPILNNCVVNYFLTREMYTIIFHVDACKPNTM